jgi:hypothetical protein
MMPQALVVRVLGEGDDELTGGLLRCSASEQGTNPGSLHSEPVLGQLRAGRLEPSRVLDPVVGATAPEAERHGRRIEQRVRFGVVAECEHPLGGGRQLT